MLLLTCILFYILPVALDPNCSWPERLTRCIVIESLEVRNVEIIESWEKGGSQASFLSSNRR